MEKDRQESRDAVRARLTSVAARLLSDKGVDAVTTRAVAQAAGVPTPYIYRLFGDKDGLLDAVVEQGFATYLDRKSPISQSDDPVLELHSAWKMHVEFGRENPELFRLMHTSHRTSESASLASASINLLSNMVADIARAGRLRVPEARAVALIHALGIGTVLAIINNPSGEGSSALPDDAWAAIRLAVIANPSPSRGDEFAHAAVTLRAGLDGRTNLTANERALFGDWLSRLAGADA